MCLQHTYMLSLCCLTSCAGCSHSQRQVYRGTVTLQSLHLCWLPGMQACVSHLFCKRLQLLCWLAGPTLLCLLWSSEA
jgi:hypothetical protein